MTIHDIPREAIGERPAGYRQPGEQNTVLLEVLAAGGVDLGEFDHDTIHWISYWDWSTVAVIASWVARAAATRETAPTVALPGRFDATAAEIDQHLRRILAEDTYLRYQQAIGARAVAEAVDETRTTDLPDDYIDLFDNGAKWAGDLIDPAKGGGLHPSQLQCSQHDGFGPCPGAPRCTPRDTPEGEA